jgi:DNA-binding GntR family transcriptional regulator
MQNKVVILPERRCAVKATYKDVKSDILSKITKGEWAPGSLVPNEVDLAATYGCARATVNRAMRELADDGRHSGSDDADPASAV